VDEISLCKQVKETAHKLKSTAGYSGASHIHYACYFLQDHFINQEYKEMMGYYPTLLEACIEFRVFHKKFIQKRDKKPFVLTPELETIPMSQGYRIVKENGKYWALFED